MTQTLGKTERLKKRDFRNAAWVKSGRSPHFLLFLCRNEHSIKRFGVVVSRKIRGSAKRNRIKRLLREFFRLNKGLFRDSTNTSVRVMQMPEHVTWQEVSRELEGLAARAGSR